jgi:hypothetical protein
MVADLDNFALYEQAAGALDRANIELTPDDQATAVPCSPR